MPAGHLASAVVLKENWFRLLSFALFTGFFTAWMKSAAIWQLIKSGHAAGYLV